jgi:mannose-6-phosphate isomerase-like protein (cupin superfamily)
MTEGVHMRWRCHVSGLLFLAATALVGPARPASAGEPSSGVQIVKQATIAGKIEHDPPSPGGRGGVFAEDTDWRLHVAERDAPGQAEMHDGDSDVWYVIAGGGTLVTGGTIVGAHVTAPGETRGPAIEGGTEHAIGVGDVVTIRRGIPHWVKAVDGRLRYLTVKVHGRETAQPPQR